MNVIVRMICGFCGHRFLTAERCPECDSRNIKVDRDGLAK